MTITPDHLDLSGKVALVTGAARGIGRAVTVSLAACGADLAVVDREPLDDVMRDVEGHGRQCVVGMLDVRDPDAVAAFVEDASERLGPVDILVNNAGGTYHAAFADSSPKGDETRSGAGAPSRNRRLTLAPSGRWASGPQGRPLSPTIPRAMYAAAKAGLESLTRTLALELGDRGIRVNAVAPDVIPTPGIGPLPDPPRTPLVHAATAGDVAGAVVFLALPLAAFVTGAVIPVDGGNAAAGGWRRDADGGWTTA